MCFFVFFYYDKTQVGGARGMLCLRHEENVSQRLGCVLIMAISVRITAESEKKTFCSGMRTWFKISTRIKPSSVCVCSTPFLKGCE